MWNIPSENADTSNEKEFDGRITFLIKGILTADSNIVI